MRVVLSDAKKMRIKVKRAYEAPGRSDGHRILVDRIWPRGASKDDLRLDGWVKEIAPSTELRRWFGHEPAKWDAFKKRYFQSLLARTRAERVTLVFGAKDSRHNNAVALKEYLERRATK